MPSNIRTPAATHTRGARCGGIWHESIRTHAFICYTAWRRVDLLCMRRDTKARRGVRELDLVLSASHRVRVRALCARWRAMHIRECVRERVCGTRDMLTA